MPYNAYPSVASTSLSASGSTIAEERIPLWVYSSANSAGVAGYSAGAYFLQKGSTAPGSSYSASSAKLHNLSNNWNASQKFALEVSFEINNTSATGYVELWDMTSNTAVAGSQLSTQVNTFSLIRSGFFTLTPGHVYGVTVWSSSTSYNCYVTKAHLIALTM